MPIPAGFFSATTTAVNDSGDVVGYAGSPNIDSHAVLWRNGMAIDLGVWPGGHYSVANGINNLGQIVGTGTVAGDNLDHALMWTVDEGTPTPTPTPTPTVQVTVQSNPAGRTFSVDGHLQIYTDVYLGVRFESHHWHNVSAERCPKRSVRSGIDGAMVELSLTLLLPPLTRPTRRISGPSIN